MAYRKDLISWEIVGLAIFILVVPFLLGESYFFETVNIIGIYVIAVIGLNLILGYGGLISLGHAGFFGLGAYLSALMSKHLLIHPFVAVVISCIIVAVFAFLISLPLLRLSGYFLALGTLGMNVIIYTIINGSSSITGGPNGVTNIPPFSIGSFQFQSFNSHFYLIWITVLILLFFAKNISVSREGRALTAIHSDEEAASFFGIPVFTYKVKIFVVGCTMAALGGGYYAHYMSFISPEVVSLHNSIDMIIMGFLGGLGTVTGPIIGTFVFQVIPELSHFFQEYEVLMKGVLLLLVILFFPGGIVSWLEKSVPSIWKFISGKTLKKDRGRSA
jgi:branched-chain amino acid transport system permease protein